tara:strand:+ start:62 stop:223 length:162 start_codon:yes stop_codon:yes gene_type:complete
MKRFRIEHNDFDKPITYVTLHNPPYENENVLSHLKWKAKDVTITECKIYQGEE